MIFTIDSENNITAIETDAAIPENTQQFRSQKELTKLVADWPPSGSLTSGTAGRA
jgi:hypothetical protein